MAGLTLACQSAADLTTAAGLESSTPMAADKWPHSTFVPEQAGGLVDVGAPLSLESYLVSPGGLSRLQILVNGQPVAMQATNEQGTIFFDESGHVQLLVDAQAGEANSVKPKFPTNSTWTVSLVWTASVPGTYDLTLVVTDAAGNSGEQITQRIEVK